MTDRPQHADDWEVLAAVAADLHAQRALHYPAHVAKGTLSLAEADAGIRIMGAIAADWRRALDRRPIPATVQPASDTEKVETLEAAAARHQRRVDKAQADMMAAFATANPPFRTPDVSIVELRSFAERGLINSPTVEKYCLLVEYGACIAALLWWARREPYGIRFITEFNIAARLRWPRQPLSNAA
jgi:hypothetical protein